MVFRKFAAPLGNGRIELGLSGEFEVDSLGLTLEIAYRRESSLFVMGITMTHQGQEYKRSPSRTLAFIWIVRPVAGDVRRQSTEVQLLAIRSNLFCVR